MTNKTVLVMQPIHNMRTDCTLSCSLLFRRKRTNCHKFYGETSRAALNMGEKGRERTKYFFTACNFSTSSLPLVLLAAVPKFLNLLEAFVKKGRFLWFSLEILIKQPGRGRAGADYEFYINTKGDSIAVLSIAVSK